MGNSTDPDVVFDSLAERAGLTIPPAWRASVMAMHEEVEAMTARLREAGLTPADEPANIYLFDPILRSA